MEYAAEPYVDPTITASWEAECLSAYGVLASMLLLMPPKVATATITGGTSEVLYLDATPDIILPTQVTITSSAALLRDKAGRAGPMSVGEAELTRATAGTPTGWAATEDRLIFNRTPAGNTAISITAYCVLTGIVSATELPHGSSIDEAVAQWVAAYIMEPRAGGESLARVQDLKAKAQFMFEDRLATAERLRTGVFGRSTRVTSQHGQNNR